MPAEIVTPKEIVAIINEKLPTMDRIICVAFDKNGTQELLMTCTNTDIMTIVLILQDYVLNKIKNESRNNLAKMKN